MKMLWLVVLYLLVTASAAADMDEINAGIRARAGALRGQPVQELRLSLVNGPVKDEPVADDGSPKNASVLRTPDPRCITFTVSAESCSLPNVRCMPPPNIDAQAQLKSL